jgi:hypothetical protein
MDIDENSEEPLIDSDENTESDGDSELSDITSNSDNEAEEEEQSESQLDSEEVRHRLRKLSSHNSSYIRRKSVGAIIPNWPDRNVDAFKRGKEARLRIPQMSLNPSMSPLHQRKSFYESPVDYNHFLSALAMQALCTLHLDPLSFSSDDLVHLTLEIFLEVNMD